jgi:hypothetical protein
MASRACRHFNYGKRWMPTFQIRRRLAGVDISNTAAPGWRRHFNYGKRHMPTFQTQRQSVPTLQMRQESYASSIT